MLKRMIAPISDKEFFSEYWEKKPLVVQHNDPEYFSDLLTIENLDDILTCRKINTPEHLNTSGLKGLDCLVDDTLNKRRLLDFYAKGETLILSQVEKYWGPIRKLNLSLQSYFRNGNINTNLYLTPPVTHGLNPHFDSWNVFVMQIHGIKHWKLYDIPITLPFDVHKALGKKRIKATKPSMEFELSPGDVLYMPRGLVHEAMAQDHASLHITFGLQKEFTWVDLLQRASEKLLRNHPHAKRSLPFLQKFHEEIKAESTMTSEETENALKETLEKLLETSAIDNAFNDYINEWNAKRWVFSRNQLHMLDDINNLSLDTIIMPRPLFQYLIKENDNETATISFHGRDMQLSLDQLKAFQYLMSKSSCKVTDLPGKLNDKEKLEFSKKLIVELAVTYNTKQQ